MSRADPHDYLDALTAHVSHDPFFLAPALASYQRRHGLDDPALAAALGCVPAVLLSLRLCRRPGAAEPDHTAAQDIADIAARFSINPAVLGQIVGETHVTDVLCRPGVS